VIFNPLPGCSRMRLQIAYFAPSLIILVAF
jgi:hypothetical protein